VKEIGRKFNFWAEQTISTVFSASCRKLGNTNDLSSYLFPKKIRVDNMQKQKKRGLSRASPDGMGQASWHGLRGLVALPFLFFFSKLFFSFFFKLMPFTCFFLNIFLFIFRLIILFYFI
jgi:hypothetical protein